MRGGQLRLVESWIEEALFAEEGQPSGIYRVDRAQIQGATPIRTETLPCARRPSLPSDICELSPDLEGDLQRNG